MTTDKQKSLRLSGQLPGGQSPGNEYQPRKMTLVIRKRRPAKRGEAWELQLTKNFYNVAALFDGEQKRFATRKAAKAFAEKHGFKVDDTSVMVYPRDYKGVRENPVGKFVIVGHTPRGQFYYRASARKFEDGKRGLENATRYKSRSHAERVATEISHKLPGRINNLLVEVFR